MTSSVFLQTILSEKGSILKGKNLLSFGADYFYLQSSLNRSNTDSSMTMANSNSFLSPKAILLITQENKYLWDFFIMKMYVVCN